MMLSETPSLLAASNELQDTSAVSADQQDGKSAAACPSAAEAVSSVGQGAVHFVEQPQALARRLAKIEAEMEALEGRVAAAEVRMHNSFITI